MKTKIEFEIDEVEEILRRFGEIEDGGWNYVAASAKIKLYAALVKLKVKELRYDLVEEFCKKQNMNVEDLLMQLGVIKEEVWEYEQAVLHESRIRQLEELADILVTVFVAAEIGYGINELIEAFNKKMDINVEKPVRDGKGKVQKK